MAYFNRMHDGVILLGYFKDILISKNSSVRKGMLMSQLKLIYSEDRKLGNHQLSIIRVRVFLGVCCFPQV